MLMTDSEKELNEAISNTKNRYKINREKIKTYRTQRYAQSLRIKETLELIPDDEKCSQMDG